MKKNSTGTTIFVWIVFIVLFPLLPLLILFDIILHWSLGVPIVFPWQVDIHKVVENKGTGYDNGVNSDNKDDYGGIATGTENNEDGAGAGQRRRRNGGKECSRSLLLFDEIIDVRSPSEYEWFRIGKSTNVPFDTDVSSWRRNELTQTATTGRENQQQQLKGKLEDDNRKNQNISENSRLNSTPTKSKQKMVLLVCMSGHRSPLMAYFLKKNDDVRHRHHHHLDQDRKEKDDDDEDDPKTDTNRNNNNSSNSVSTQTTNYYNLYGGMIFWKLCGKECTYG